MIAPGTAHIESFRLSFIDSMPRLLKEEIAPTFWTMMAMRLVPLATEASRPRKIRAGRPSAEPPPAVTFRNPAAMPTAYRRI